MSNKKVNIFNCVHQATNPQNKLVPAKQRKIGVGRAVGLEPKKVAIPTAEPFFHWIYSTQFNCSTLLHVSIDNSAHACSEIGQKWY
jgi:hypothetical protein